MTRTPLLIMLVASAALAGCNKASHTIVTGPPEDNLEANASSTPVALPPNIQETKTYRCADNSVVVVDWMSDGSTHVKKKSGEVPTVLPVGSPDLKGDAKAASITYKGQSCSA